MLHPTIDEVNAKNENKGYNRYQVALAAAKAARVVTNEYIEARDEAEANATSDGAAVGTKIDARLRDVNPVVNAVEKMGAGEFVIVEKEEEQEG